MIELKLFKKMDFSGYSFIEGFPGFGLVGPMAISYIIDKLHLDYVGYLESEDFPPLISIHKNTPMAPIRVYRSEKQKIVTIFAEFAIPLELMHKLTDTIYEFIRSNKISKIFSIGGIPMQTNATEKSTFVLASLPSLVKAAQDAGFKPVGEGVATGISALLLIRASLDKIPDTNIMIPITQNVINPLYAELAIKSLTKLMKLNVDTTDLDKEAKVVEARIRELAKKHAESSESLKKSVNGTGPSMYA